MMPVPVLKMKVATSLDRTPCLPSDDRKSSALITTSPSHS